MRIFLWLEANEDFFVLVRVGYGNLSARALKVCVKTLQVKFKLGIK